MSEPNTWSEKMEAIIETRIPRDEAMKLADECAEIADGPERERVKPSYPLCRFRDGATRSVALIYGELLAADDKIRTVDGAKEHLRQCGRMADEAESA